MKFLAFKIKEKTIIYDPFFNIFFETNLKINNYFEFYETDLNLYPPYFKDLYIQENLNLKETELLNINPPLSFIILTNKCNDNCSFCYAKANTDKTEQEFTLKDIEYIKEKFGENARDCVLTGGEPLLFFDKIKEFRPYFEKMKIYTNGSLLDEKNIKWFIDTKTSLYINLDYHREEKIGHSKVLELRNKISNFLKNFPELESLLTFSSVLSLDEVSKIPEFEKQTEDFERKIPKQIFLYGGLGENLKWKDIFNILDYINDDFEFGSKFLDIFYNKTKDFILSNKINTKSCDYSFSINYNKDIFLCMTAGSNPETKFLKIGNMFDLSLEDIKKEIIKRRRKEIFYCLDKYCFAKGICGGICWQNLRSTEKANFQCKFYQYMIPVALYIYLNQFPETVRTMGFLDSSDLKKISLEDDYIFEKKSFGRAL